MSKELEDLTINDGPSESFVNAVHLFKVIRIRVIEQLLFLPSNVNVSRLDVVGVEDGIWDCRIEGIKQVGEGYIIATVDEPVTEGD